MVYSWVMTIVVSVVILTFGIVAVEVRMMRRMILEEECWKRVVRL